MHRLLHSAGEVSTFSRAECTAAGYTRLTKTLFTAVRSALFSKGSAGLLLPPQEYSQTAHPILQGECYPIQNHITGQSVSEYSSLTNGPSYQWSCPAGRQVEGVGNGHSQNLLKKLPKIQMPTVSIASKKQQHKS